MAINANEDAYHILDEPTDGIPFEAIQYLCQQPTSPELLDKICFALRHAYDGTYCSDAEHFTLPTPLWYGIVAEAHIDPQLIDPVITMVTCTDADWDFLNEQAMCLIDQLAESFPDETIAKVMTATEIMCAQRNNYPYLFLFDAFYFANAKKHGPWLIQMLEHDGLFWPDALASHIAHLKLKEAIPVLHRLIDELKQEPDPEFGPRAEAELEYSLRELETGHVEYPDVQQPFIKQRGDWEQHYRQFEDRFHPDLEDGEELTDEELAELEAETEEAYRAIGILPPKQSPLIYPEIKIGRNQPCPCGSNKKYKKCHGAD